MIPATGPVCCGGWRRSAKPSWSICGARWTSWAERLPPSPARPKPWTTSSAWPTWMAGPSRPPSGSEAVLDGVEPMLFRRYGFAGCPIAPARGGVLCRQARRLHCSSIAASCRPSPTIPWCWKPWMRSTGSARQFAPGRDHREARSRGTGSVPPVGAVRAEAASLHEGSGHLAAAIAAWRAGREGDETNQTALDELARLYESRGRARQPGRDLARKGQNARRQPGTVCCVHAGGRHQVGPAGRWGRRRGGRQGSAGADPQDMSALAALVDLEEHRGDFAGPSKMRFCASPLGAWRGRADSCSGPSWPRTRANV